MAKRENFRGAPEEHKITGGRAGRALVYAQRIGLESGADHSRDVRALETETRDRRSQRQRYGLVARAGPKAETAREAAAFRTQSPHHESGKLNHAFSGEPTICRFDGGKANG